MRESLHQRYLLFIVDKTVLKEMLYSFDIVAKAELRISKQSVAEETLHTGFYFSFVKIKLSPNRELILSFTGM